MLSERVEDGHFVIRTLGRRYVLHTGLPADLTRYRWYLYEAEPSSPQSAAEVA